MKANEARDAREAMLESWLGLLRSASEHQHAKTSAALEVSGGKPIKPPPLELHGVTDDMLEVLTAGIERALDGTADPFDIKPRKSSRPRLNRQKRVHMVMEIMHSIDEGAATIPAINDVAGRYAVSLETARDAFYDKDVQALARISLDAYRHKA